MFSLGGVRKAGPSLEHRLIPKVSPISGGQMKTLVGRSFSGGRRSKMHRTCARRGAGGGYCGNLSEDVRPEFFLRARRGFLHREGERREALMVRAHADGARGRKEKNRAGSLQGAGPIFFFPPPRTICVRTHHQRLAPLPFTVQKSPSRPQEKLRANILR